MHTVQTVGLALATDLAPQESQPKVVGLMYVMLLFGMIVSALTFGVLLAEYSPGRLVQVIQGAAVTTLILNVLALWKQESRDRSRKHSPKADPTFRESWESFSKGGYAVRRLIAVGLGTMAFAMEDVLLEPYGGEILKLSVGATTLLTATLAAGSLIGFGFASRVLSRGADPYRMAASGAIAGIPAFVAVIIAAPLQSIPLFAAGTFLIGLGAGLFGHGTLTATMQHAPKHQVGLALGTWGAVQATAAGVAMALGGMVRDLVVMMGSPELPGLGLAGAASGYVVVYIIEAVLLVATLASMVPLMKRSGSGEFTGSPAH